MTVVFLAVLYGAHTVKLVRSASSPAGKFLTLYAVDIWGSITNQATAGAGRTRPAPAGIVPTVVQSDRRMAPG